MFDQSNLFLTTPSLYLLFTLDSRQDVSVRFVVHQTMDFVSLGESFDRLDLMLLNAAGQVTSDPDVHSPCPAD